jgi:hypothetical protein
VKAWIGIHLGNGKHGQAYQESLGTPHRPHGRHLYVLSLYISLLAGTTPNLSMTVTDQNTDQVAAALEGFFWPKIFWDFLTKNLDGAVKPLPILQIINLVFGIFFLAWEWPLKFLAGSSLHRSIEARLVILPLAALAASLLYQATNPAIYYTIGLAVYFWAYSDGEVRFASRALAVLCTETDVLIGCRCYAVVITAAEDEY